MFEQLYGLQCWKQNFDPMRENLHSAVSWVRLPRLPLEMWNENILGAIFKPVGRLCKDPSQVDDSHGFKVGGMILQEADWIEVKWKRTDPLYQQVPNTNGAKMTSLTKLESYLKR